VTDILRAEGVNVQGFGTIPKAVMKSREISLGAKALYAYIRSYCGGGESAWPGRDLIMADLGINSKTTYYKYLNELKEEDLIRVEQKVDEGGKFSKNVFTVVEVPNPDKKAPCPKKCDTDTVSQKNRVPKNGTPKKWDTNINSNININSKENNNNNKDTSINKVTNNIENKKSNDVVESRQEKNCMGKIDESSIRLKELIIKDGEEVGIPIDDYIAGQMIKVGRGDEKRIRQAVKAAAQWAEGKEVRNWYGVLIRAVADGRKPSPENETASKKIGRKDKYRELYMNWGG
jgi:hypothetical protein